MKLPGFLEDFFQQFASNVAQAGLDWLLRNHPVLWLPILAFIAWLLLDFWARKQRLVGRPPPETHDAAVDVKRSGNRPFRNPDALINLSRALPHSKSRDNSKQARLRAMGRVLNEQRRRGLLQVQVLTAEASVSGSSHFIDYCLESQCQPLLLDSERETLWVFDDYLSWLKGECASERLVSALNGYIRRADSSTLELVQDSSHPWLGLIAKRNRKRLKRAQAACEAREQLPGYSRED